MYTPMARAQAYRRITSLSATASDVFGLGLIQLPVISVGTRKGNECVCALHVLGCCRGSHFGVSACICMHTNVSQFDFHFCKEFVISVSKMTRQENCIAT